jgi:hypothetical protein
VSTLLVDLGAWPAASVVASTGVPTAVLAQDPAPPPGEGPEFGKASPVALVVIVLLGIATVFLIRSMTKHLRRVPASFDEPARTGAPEAGADAGEREPAEPRSGDDAPRTGEKADPPG